jgi:chemotaxis signal transduction protein
MSLKPATESGRGSLRERLQSSQRLLDQVLGSGRREKETILSERAVKLARLQKSELDFTHYVRVLAFQLGQERYAIPVKYVARVIAGVQCTLVPGARPALAGLINVEGQVCPVTHLARLLNLPDDAQISGSNVLLLENHGRQKGLLVGFVDAVRPLTAEPREGTGHEVRFLKGITPDGLMILDGEALLKEELL